MSDFQTEMNRAVQGFVAQITECARRAAITTLESALSNQGGRNGRAALSAALNGGRSAKRSAEDLEALSEKFATFVKANPGMRIEQINKELGTSTKDLVLPIRKLIADGEISVKGQKRSTTYFPGKKSAKKA